MRQKTSLSLMELAVMVAVFALAAAICLRAFVWADTHSRRSEAESRAMAVAQTAAETIKSTHGDFIAAAAQLGVIPRDDGGNGLVIGYDENWNQIDSQKLIDGVDDSAYYLEMARHDSGVSGLGKAIVCVYQNTPHPLPDNDGTYTDCPFIIDYMVEFYVAWQEEIDWGGDGQ